MISDDGSEVGADRGPAHVQAIADQLVAWPSETGTSGEVAFAERLKTLLLNLDYFRTRPDQVIVIDSHGTPPARNVVALVCGRGRRCVALAGHYDTVGTRDYRSLAAVARDPEALRVSLIAEFEAHTANVSERLALADLIGGDFRAGRGMLDMKSGDAAGISVLERFAEAGDRDGNLLLLLTPDEENLSRGMRSLRDALPRLAQQWGLDIVAGINLDAVSDLGDGSSGRSIHYGTVGKLLPFAFVIGRSTHAGYPFDGVSSHLIGAEIIRAMEANVELCDEGYGETAPPPICLEARDMRAEYNVTTPGAMWLAFNWLTHRRSPEEVLSLFRKIVRTAMQAALDRQAEQSERFSKTVFVQQQTLPESAVLSLDALRERVKTVAGAATMQRHEALITALEKEENPLVVSRRLVADLIDMAQIDGPAVVVGFGSLHYPHTHVGEADGVVAAAMQEAAEEAAAHHETSIRRREFFAGISDMSFFGVRADPAGVAFLQSNTPSPGFVDVPAPEALRFPVVNIGPWGRDYHQRLERVHAPYAFEVLPDLLLAAVKAALDVTKVGSSDHREVNVG